MKKHRGGTSATTAWVKATKFRVPKVSPAAGKAIMLVLADYVDSDGATWLGAKALAELADISERVVRRFIAGAIEAQWICTEVTKKPSGRGRDVDRLYVHVEGEAMFCNCALALDQHANLADEKVGTNLPPGADQPATQGQKPRATPLIPEPAREPATRASDESALFTDNNGSTANGLREKDPDYGFEKFWTAYPARKGHKLNKAKAIPIWRKLTYDEKAEAWRAAKNFAAAVETDDILPPDAFRWLRDRLWPEWLEAPTKEPDLDPLYDVR